MVFKDWDKSQNIWYLHLIDNASNLSRQTFIKTESEERIRRAVRHDVRGNKDFINNGHYVYYKREDINEWRSPSKAVGQDDKVILVKHGSNMIRMNNSRITRCNYNIEYCNRHY